MHRPRFVLPPSLKLEELDAYQGDVVASLSFYFSPAAPTFVARFAGQSLKEVADQLDSRLLESNIRSTLAVLTSLEAHFRIDFNARCEKKLKDDLSIYFRKIKKTPGERRSSL
jgi:hypothetical protein